MRLTTDTSGRFNVRSNGTDTHKSTHADAESVDAVSCARAFKVKGNGVAQACEFRHGVQGTMKVELEHETGLWMSKPYPVVSRPRMDWLPGHENKQEGTHPGYRRKEK